jgi:DNA-binding transcriptional ArsR family regulator
MTSFKDPDHCLTARRIEEQDKAKILASLSNEWQTATEISRACEMSIAKVSLHLTQMWTDCEVESIIRKVLSGRRDKRVARRPFYRRKVGPENMQGGPPF